MNKLKLSLVFLSLIVLSACSNLTEKANDETQVKMLKALIIDGQNNHVVWPMSTMMMKRYLEDSGRFTVDIERTKYTWNYNKFGPQYPLNDGKKYTEHHPTKTDPQFSPQFEKYDVVISNFGWKTADWPQQTKQNFENYMKNGGGFVVIHAANNAFPNWLEYNKMIGLGGWGGRNESHGPYVYYDKDNKLVRDTRKGNGGGHGKQVEFTVTTRAENHPIMQGIPTSWLHTRDELYVKLRGPAENMTVLATAYDTQKTHRHEPVLMAIDYHQGRIFHSTLGHAKPAFESVGFIATLQRGTEWAATGKVTIPVPEDFPTETQTSIRAF
ncbi:ThuA domain-containing protein [Catenovulum sediminis]|uniref:ThuA domain-containing protein n=1 Tax=Catenovulum sediminis TaxID=1740262 RepID=UPI00117D0E23|nr:ThuA domain-containing protein [Catenovulum sediminis]